MRARLRVILSAMTTQKRPVGRPKKDKSHVRNQFLYVRLSKAEKAEVTRAAGREGAGPAARRVLVEWAHAVNKNK